MLLGVRLFVLCVFVALGLSFIALPVALMLEFPAPDALTLGTFYSHLFVFFPTFGVATLCAFYTPACVFTDMYWKYVRHGRLRFGIGFAVLAAVSVSLAAWLGSGDERSMFEIAPAVLARDAGDPAGCGTTGRQACRRLGVLTAANNVREVSQRRIGLADLGRSCRGDPLLEPVIGTAQRKRFCFASTPLREGAPLLTDAECCSAQKGFVEAIGEMYADTGHRSLTGRVHHSVLAGKIFFMLVLLLISVLLAVRRKSLDSHYAALLPGIERGVLIGAVAMVIYPVMSHAFLQSAALLYGATSEVGYRATAPYFTFAFGAWAILLLLFFYRRRDKEIEALGRLGGMLAGAVAVFKYDLIIDVFVRGFGSGATAVTLIGLVVVAVFAIVALFVQSFDETFVRRIGRGSGAKLP